jgi:hypothetical protein
MARGFEATVDRDLSARRRDRREGDLPGAPPSRQGFTLVGVNPALYAFAGLAADSNATAEWESTEHGRLLGGIARAA